MNSVHWTLIQYLLYASLFTQVICITYSISYSITHCFIQPNIIYIIESYNLLFTGMIRIHSTPCISANFHFAWAQEGWIFKCVKLRESEHFEILKKYNLSETLNDHLERTFASFIHEIERFYWISSSKKNIQRMSHRLWLILIEHGQKSSVLTLEYFWCRGKFQFT